MEFDLLFNDLFGWALMFSLFSVIREFDRFLHRGLGQTRVERLFDSLKTLHHI